MTRDPPGARPNLLFDVDGSTKPSFPVTHIQHIDHHALIEACLSDLPCHELVRLKKAEENASAFLRSPRVSIGYPRGCGLIPLAASASGVPNRG
jgi:hypothetical protein